MAKKATPKPRVCILRTAGTNCDQETAFAFQKAGAVPELVHINTLVADKALLSGYQILALSGGFSYGDDVASGKIFANELKYKLFDELKRFVDAGKLIIGICNGFQILVKAGILPGNARWEQTATLTHNDSGKFEDRWVHLKKVSDSCVWTQGIRPVIYLPVAHGEGKFVPRDASALSALKAKGQIVFQYCTSRGNAGEYPDNPNGSLDHIAGICDETGRVFGLMPHPERHVSFLQHPRWAMHDAAGKGDGLQIFVNGVECAKRLR
jgi:phosphoribosylformylglycinamidine synthase subunit PurQ / glutaminase